MRTMDQIFIDLINSKAIGTELLRSEYIREYTDERGIKSLYVAEMDTAKHTFINLGFLKVARGKGRFVVVKHVPEGYNVRMEFEKLKGRTLSAPLTYQEGGDHYLKMKYQPLAIICKCKMSFIQGCVLKYVSRYKNKNGVEDLKKALQYIRLGIPMGETKAKSGAPVRFLSDYIVANNLTHTEGMILQYALACKWSKAEDLCKELVKVEYGTILE